MVRAIRLLEVGDVDAARREVSASGALADGVDTEVVWAVGALYNQAGLPELGHAFSRGKLTDFLAHYPEGKWRIPWQVAYPRAFEGIVVKACSQASLPTPLAWAIMREESSFVADVRSHANAYGLMQLIPPTAKWVAAGTTLPSDEASLKRPEVSVELGTRLLSKLRVTHGHPALAIGAYNGGGGAVERWVTARTTDELDLFVELVPYDETRNYIKRVLSSQAAYAYLYDPTALKEPLGLPLRLGR
jgi:soluble lytic murein transglycosylase